MNYVIAANILIFFLDHLREMDKKYNLFMLASVLQDRSSTLEWLTDVELIGKERLCKINQINMVLIEAKGVYGQFKCFKKKKYRHQTSIAEDTWLERCDTSPAACIIIAYCFSVDMTFQQTIRKCSIVVMEQVSPETLADIFSFCR